MVCARRLPVRPLLQGGAGVKLSLELSRGNFAGGQSLCRVENDCWSAACLRGCIAGREGIFNGGDFVAGGSVKKLFGGRYSLYSFLFMGYWRFGVHGQGSTTFLCTARRVVQCILLPPPPSCLQKVGRGRHLFWCTRDVKMGSCSCPTHSFDFQILGVAQDLVGKADRILIYL